MIKTVHSLDPAPTLPSLTARDVFTEALTHSSPLVAADSLFAYRKNIILNHWRESFADCPQIIPIWAGNTKLSLFSDTDLTAFALRSDLTPANEELIYDAVRKCQALFQDPKSTPSDVHAPMVIMIRESDDVLKAIDKYYQDLKPKSRAAAEMLLYSMLKVDWTYAKDLQIPRELIFKAQEELSEVFYKVAEKYPDFLRECIFNNRRKEDYSLLSASAYADIKSGGLRVWQDLSWSTEILKYLGFPDEAKSLSQNYLNHPDIQEAFETVIAIRHCLHLTCPPKNLASADQFTAEGEQEFLRIQAHQGLTNIDLGQQMPREKFHHAARTLYFALNSLKDEINHILHPQKVWFTEGSLTGEPIANPNDLLKVLAESADTNFAIHHGEFRNLMNLAGLDRTNIETNLERDPELLLKIFSAGPGTGQVVRLLKDSGLLLKLFSQLSPAEAHFPNPLHTFTVNEHAVKGLELLSKLADPSSDLDPRFKKLYQQLSKEERGILNLACLFHDSGYPSETASNGRINHNIASGLIAAQELKRWNVSSEYIEPIVNLVEFHRWMISCSHSPVWFMESEVNSAPDVLKTMRMAGLLCLLTYADLHTTAPQFWNRMEANNIYQTYTKLVSSLGTIPNGYQEIRNLQANFLISEYPDAFSGIQPEQIVKFFEHFSSEFLSFGRVTLKSFFEIDAMHQNSNHQPVVKIFPHRSFESDYRANDGARYDLLYACDNAPGVLLKIIKTLNSNALVPLGIDIFTSDQGTAYGRITFSTVEDFDLAQISKTIEKNLASISIEPEKSSGFSLKDIADIRVKVRSFPKIPNSTSEPFLRLRVAVNENLAVLPHLLNFLLSNGFDISSATIVRRPNQKLFQLFLTTKAENKLKEPLALEQALLRSF